MTAQVEVLEPVEVQGRRAAGWERVSAVQAKEAWPLQVFPEVRPHTAVHRSMGSTPCHGL